MIFPCSDFRHAVMTPALLLMVEYLMRCPVLSVRDAAVGSFLCSIVLSVCHSNSGTCHLTQFFFLLFVRGTILIKKTTIVLW